MQHGKRHWLMPQGGAQISQSNPKQHTKKSLIPPLPNTGRPATSALSFDVLPIAGIKANPHNAREHDRKQIEKLKRSIERFGFITPLVIDDSNELLAGTARLEVAKQLGYALVPVIRASHLTESEKRAFILADNKLAELASWNRKALRRELQFLTELDIDFDFAAIGFETAEVDFVLETNDEADERADSLPRMPDLPPVTKLGDLWRLGEHRLYCGSALERSSYGVALAGDRADMVFTDPPYNVPISGHVGGRGAVKHREFAMASGEMKPEQFQAFLATTASRIGEAVCDGAICFVCMDWRHCEDLLKATKCFELKNICVWVKNNGGMGSLYRSQHEFVFVFKCGAAEHINNVELGRYGRNRTNVWEYRGSNSFGADRESLLKYHPTVKPVAMAADAIRDCSRRGGLILDPFGGSGTTLIAAEKTKRRAALIELDPLYADVTIRRWQTYTRGVAVNAATGASFSDGPAPPLLAP
jgi:DNA modification methylase